MLVVLYMVHIQMSFIAWCADLKYMLIQAMHGDILSQTQAREPEVRRHTLQSAIKHYSRWTCTAH